MSTTNHQIISPEWRLKKFRPEQLEFLTPLGFSQAMQKALAQLELKDRKEVDSFLTPSLEAWTQLKGFPSLDASVQKVWDMIQDHQPVCIHGDFDTDGLCATTVLRTCLENLGIEVFGHLPQRGQGHGISLSSLDEVIAKGAKCVITVDCGVSALDVGIRAKELGVPLVITDHHLSGDTLPEALAVINPQLDPKDDNAQNLCGAGVALKLSLELSRLAPPAKTRSPEFQSFFRHAVVLTAIATIGDVMPLTGDNRALVQKALTLLPEITWPGLKALISSLRLSATSRAEDLAFQLIPRLNSAQRLERGDLLKSLLECQEEAEGVGIVSEMNQLNLKRREMQAGYSELALERAKDLPTEAHLTWVTGNEWMEGFSGLMASRLVQSYARPAAVVKIDGEELHASCRAPEGYNLKEAMDQCSDLFFAYGGHAQAAGFRASLKDADAIQAKLNEVLGNMADSKASPQLLILADIPYPEIKESLLGEINSLEPFGQGNPRPLFATRGLMIDGNPRIMGPLKNHVGFKVFAPGMPSMEAIGFGLASELLALDAYGKIDLAYHLGRSPYQNQLQLQVQAVRQHKNPMLHRR